MVDDDDDEQELFFHLFSLLKDPTTSQFTLLRPTFLSLLPWEVLAALIALIQGGLAALGGRSTHHNTVNISCTTTMGTVHAKVSLFTLFLTLRPIEGRFRHTLGG